MRICVVTQQIGKIYSGPGVHSRNLVMHLLEDGHEVVVLSLKDQWFQDIDLPGKSLYKFIGIDRPLFPKNQARWFLLSIIFNQVLRRIEREKPFDVIHFTDVRDGFLCKSQAPRIGNVNDTYSADLQPISYYHKNYFDWISRWGYYRISHLFEQLFLGKYDAVIANSNFTAETIRFKYPRVRSKVFRIYKSIDRSQFQDVLEERSRKPDVRRNKILVIGSNLQRKGIRYLIDAASIIKDDQPSLEYIIVGNDPTIPKLKELCRIREVHNLFSFVGYQDHNQIKKLFSDACIFVLPALTEALGIVILEAMASGVPVIASNTGGIPEIVKHGVNGLLVEPENGPDLACKITELLQNSDRQREFVKGGLETLTSFTIEEMLARTYDLYQSISNTRS
jgi:glycosyltransferase involved in cell wall biosynthesis